MTERELSEKLSELADILESLTGDNEDVCYDLSKQLRQLSNKKYTPGNVSWDDVKQQAKNTKQSYTNKAGKRTPF